MAQKILIKKSTVAAKAPTDAQLDVGELAVNTADALLYTKHSDGSVKLLSPTMTERAKIADSVSSSDARLTNSREWTGATVSQAEAEAGTASTRRAWTSQRVRQAINAWWQLVTSGFGRNLVSASNEAAARNALQLTYPATAPTVGVGAEVMRAGAFGWGATTDTPVTMDANLCTTSGVYQGGAGAINFFPLFGALGTLIVTRRGSQIEQLNQVGAGILAIRASTDAGVTWSQWIQMYHTNNLLNVGTTPQGARDVLELGTAATRDVGTSAGDVMEVGAFGWGATTETPISMDANLSIIAGVYQGGGEHAINFAVFGNYGTLTVTRRGAQVEQFNQIGSLGAATRNSMDEGVTWSDWRTIHNSFNQLTLGITPASAQAALELTGEWVDLRPHLKAPFYWQTSRAATNPYPRIRKLSCGRVELDGVVSIDANTALIPIGGAFVNVPAPFRPTLTSAGVIFADTADPLYFGWCNWIVCGEVQYGGNGVHGDINLIGLHLPTPFEDGALSLNGIFWHTT